METACSLLRQQLLQDVPLAFSDKLEPQNVVNFPPVRVSVREDMVPVKVYSAHPFPLGREGRCREIIADLIAAGTIEEYILQTGSRLLSSFARGHQTVVWFAT